MKKCIFALLCLVCLSAPAKATGSLFLSGCNSQLVVANSFNPFFLTPNVTVVSNGAFFSPGFGSNTLIVQNRGLFRRNTLIVSGGNNINVNANRVKIKGKRK